MYLYKKFLKTPFNFEFCLKKIKYIYLIYNSSYDKKKYWYYRLF